MTLISSGNTTNTDVSSQYGLNATLLAKTGTVSVTGGSITSSGSGANLAFATGPGSAVYLTNVTMCATGGNAHAVDVTCCGVIVASNATLVTRGGSSSAIATDYGGGTVTVVLPSTNLAAGAYRLLAYVGALSGAPTFTCSGADSAKAAVSTNTAGVVTVTVTSSNANTCPVLTAITNRTVTVGTRLSITNTATDADAPAQTLTFSLLSGPTNASLNASSGVLFWRPLVSQAGTTNLFSECVTDSGSPAMSATQSFTVAVAALAQPICSSCIYTSGVFRLSISGVVGPDYIIQACTNLADQTWTTLRTNNPAVLPFL